MCEFNVILDGQTVFGDVIYAKVDGCTVVVRNILGVAQEYKDVRVVEVDVVTARFVLESVKV